MNRIAYRPNFEVCTANGSTLYVDMYIYDRDGDMEYILYYPNSSNEVLEDFDANEMDAWTENVTWYELFHPETHYQAMIDVKQVVKNYNEIASGSTPNHLPTIPYMSNDTNTLDDRTDCDWDYCMSLLIVGCHHE